MSDIYEVARVSFGSFGLHRNGELMSSEEVASALNELISQSKHIRELESTNADLYEALERCRNALKIYAQEDCIAGGNGLGCMSDPHSVVALPIEQADAALAKARGEEPPR